MSKMITKKAHFHSNHLVSIVNKAQIASLQGKRVKSLFSLQPVFAVDLTQQN